jgi:hypothetical protein
MNRPQSKLYDRPFRACVVYPCTSKYKPTIIYTPQMSSTDSESSERGWSSSEFSAGESNADRIRRNDQSLTLVFIRSYAILEILDALKSNSVVKHVVLELDTETLLQESQEVFVKLSEVMKCKSRSYS